MIICGIKLTHDASIALIDNGKLIFCHEFEKINNNPRHCDFTLSIDQTVEFLYEKGYSLKDINRVVIDGWKKDNHPIFLERGFKIASYGTLINGGNILDETTFDHSHFTGKSYKHVSGHVVGAYCSSPFAKKSEDSFILVWDGGMLPQLFYYNFKMNVFENIKNLFPLTAHVYGSFAHYFEPFNSSKYNVFSTPGIAMAFTGIGQVRDELLLQLQNNFPGAEVNDELTYEASDKINSDYISGLMTNTDINTFEGDDIMATFQKFIGDLLINGLKKAIQETSNENANLCITGGAALNIAWNSAIRDSKLFENVWVPPFPNDSGSAIGAACCEMIKYSKNKSLDWDVYSGPPIFNSDWTHPWEEYECPIAELAKFLYQHGEPIIMLNENAELGPRALGNRSILAPATDLAMKHLLNHIKEREYYRPVAPICLEEDASDIFIPGTPDPHMLFTHEVKTDWQKIIPAVCHVDGTARLQTVRQSENRVIYELLSEYKKLSGIPLLCNTSANFKGKGFFPDIDSAMRWGKVNAIWSNNYLYIKKGHSKFQYNMNSKKTRSKIPQESLEG